jgi:putative oxidoreductase
MSTTVKTVSTVVARVVLGLAYLVFGLNFFLNFIPNDAQHGEIAGKFLGGLFSAGYFFPFLKGIEIVFGAFLIGRLFVPLSVVALFPITVNILLFHAFLEPGTVALSVVMFVLNVYLLWVYRDSLRPLLQSKSQLAA